METKYFEYFVTLLCGLVFILLMEDIWIKFNSKLTNTGIKFTHIDDPNRLLPFLTGKYINQLFKTHCGTCIL